MEYLKKHQTKVLLINMILLFLLLLLLGSYLLKSTQQQRSAPTFRLSELKEPFEYITIERVIDQLNIAFYTDEPQQRDDGVVVGKHPQTTALMTLAEEIAHGDHPAYDSVLIAHQDKLIFESYFAYGRIDLPHHQASATKSYTALVIGRAIQLGYMSMEDLHKPVLSFLTDIDPSNLTAGVDKITLHHTLSMRSGLRISDETQQALAEDPKQVAGQKLAQAYFTHSAPVTKDIQIYHYQSIDTRISMLVLASVLPNSVESFIKQELFDKLDITQYFWENNIAGVPEAAYGTSVTSRDMLKLGILLKNNGKWHGEQLISESFLQQATVKVATPTHDEWDYSGYQYGYYFWGKMLQADNRQFNAKIIWGGGTQMIIVIAELELVITITGRARNQGINTISLIETRILPVFI